MLPQIPCTSDIHKRTDILYIVYIRGYFKKFPHFIFLKIFIYVTDMRTRLLFNIISLLLDTFSPAICKLLNAVGKESLWLTAKPVMHRLFHLIISCKSTTSYSILEGSKQMEIWRGQVWAVGRVLENFPFQLPNGVDGEVCCMRACIVV